jgi:hypothetical protein
VITFGVAAASLVNVLWPDNPSARQGERCDEHGRRVLSASTPRHLQHAVVLVSASESSAGLVGSERVRRHPHHN